MRRAVLLFLALTTILLIPGCGGALCRACAGNPQLNGCAEAYKAGICKPEPIPTTEPPPTTTTTTTTPTTVPAEPTPEPTVSPSPCLLGTPSYREVTNPSWGISAYGRGFHFTPKARFGQPYCSSIGLGCMPGTGQGGTPCVPRTECPVAPDGHPQRRACEVQFTETAECPIVTMGRCTGVGNQCPVTFDAWIYEAASNSEVPHPINRTAGCSAEGMLPQNGEKIRAQWAQPSGKGTLKVCFDNGWCTESKEFDQ